MGDFDPYQAPREITDEAVPSFQYRSLRGLCLVLTILLVMNALGSIVEIAEGLAGPGINEEQFAEPTFSLWDLATFGNSLVLLAAFVTFGIFLYRSNVNARALDFAHIKFSPGSMVWWFAVPVANLFKPYQAFREVWRASAPRELLPASSDLIKIWWGSWVVDSLISGATWRLHLTGRPPLPLIVIESGAHFVSAILAVLVVRSLTIRQDAGAAHAQHA